MKYNLAPFARLKVKIDIYSKFNQNLSSFLIPDKDKSKLLKAKINEKNKFICGISWFSKNEKIGNSKSLSLNQLLPILKLKNIIFVDS